MKIDDPQVQEYIKGDMSPEEESRFKEELAQHPEVADLAETLKRTASLIQEDHKNNEAPYGMELNKPSPTTKKLFEDHEEPEAAWARFFYSIMGKSWRFGVMVLALTAGISIIAFVIVPLVRSYNISTESANTAENLKTLMKEPPEKNQQGYSNPSQRNIPTHTSKTQQVPPEMADAFSEMLDPSNRTALSSRTVQTLSDLAKTASTDFGKIGEMQGHVVSLPVSYETSLQQQIKQKIIRDKKWDSESIQTDAFVNSFFSGQSSNTSDKPVLRAQWKTAPWDKSKVLLMTEIQAPQGPSAADAKEFVYLMIHKQPESLIRSLKAQSNWSQQSKVLVADDSFSDTLTEAMELASSSGQTLVVVADDSFGQQKSDFFLDRTKLFPKLSMAFLSLNPFGNESHLRVRSAFNGNKLGRYFTVPTLSDVYRAQRALQGSEKNVYESVRWSIEFKNKFVSKAEMVGQVKAGSHQVFAAKSNWLVPGDRVVVFFLLELNETEPSDEIAKLRFRFRQSGEMTSQTLESPLVRNQGEALVTDAVYSFGSQLIWTGLMLQGRLPLEKSTLLSIQKDLNQIELEPEMGAQKSQFADLLDTLINI